MFQVLYIQMFKKYFLSKYFKRHVQRTTHNTRLLGTEIGGRRLRPNVFQGQIVWDGLHHLPLVLEVHMQREISL